MIVAATDGLVFSSGKCNIKIDSIPFCGITYPVKVSSLTQHTSTRNLQDMPRPKSKKEVQEFLGFITYLWHFIPKLAEKSSSARSSQRRIRFGGGGDRGGNANTFDHLQNCQEKNDAGHFPHHTITTIVEYITQLEKKRKIATVSKSPTWRRAQFENCAGFGRLSDRRSF